MLECSSASSLQALLQQNGPELGPSDIAAAWHVAAQKRLLTLVRSGHPGEVALASHLLYLVDQHAAGMDPASLSTTAWALASTECGSSKLIESLIAFSQHRLVGFLPSQLCTLLWAAASHPELDDHRRHDPFFFLANLVEQGMRLELFSPRDISLLLWSMGKVAYMHSTVLAAAEAECAVQIDKFTPADISRAMHGFSMLRHNPVSLREPLESYWGAAGKERLTAFNPDEITLFVVAHGKLGLEPDNSFMRSIIRRISALVPPVPKPEGKRKRRATSAAATAAAEAESNPSKFLHPRHMAHLMWSFARLDYRPAEPSFFTKCLKHLEINPGLYCLEDLTVILWSCSHLKIEVPENVVVASALRAIALAPKEQSPAMLTSVLRHLSAVAAARMQQQQQYQSSRSNSNSSDALFPVEVRKYAALCAALLAPVVSKLSPEDLSSTIIALGTLEMAAALPRQVTLQLQKACLTSANKFTSETIPLLAWGVVRLRWQSPQLVDSLASAAAVRCALLPPEGLAQLGWAFAAMDRTHANLAAALVTQCTVKLQGFSARDKARLAWAFAHLAHRHEVISQKFLSGFIRSFDRNELSKLDAVSVAAIVWSCGRLERHPGPVLEAAAQRVLQNSNFYSREQLAQVKAVLMKHSSSLEF
ncbi:hypothetical protein NADE_005544 [Nannochloris sp. 'desiccata']|nr:hypothetical protein KSW81_007465 [Chlorella desiccata (nom. nud.)]KAH7618695.1 hypothetical protein NADE_005544 [Chlorella desiccata (nom. nud.)]